MNNSRALMLHHLICKYGKNNFKVLKFKKLCQRLKSNEENLIYLKRYYNLLLNEEKNLKKTIDK